MQLTREDIITTAVELLNSYGFADMTMRRIATTLGVVPGALYWHVANKQALIAEIASSFVAHLHGDSALELVANLRKILLSHRDGAELVTTALSQADSPTWATLTQKFADALRDTGADESSRLIAAETLVHLVLGTTVMDQNRIQLAQATAEAPVSAPDDTALLQGAEIIITGVSQFAP
ncbi:TetR family transcriptional regulator [Corynebacterium ammoniagenes]|uniref:HTH tetR-type domain-containing protein n=1 Tax=Corynebacterium ammoniagenes TaxID=1697 RepID=A0AAV5G575_CORAM|nr:TetR family transcriptional regulator [Corynebacterium ammoniagenes]GJN42171.1 hypothetical protein CAT723_06500 [Corynebacterium ammoniagenes]